MDGERGDVGTEFSPSSPYESLHVRLYNVKTKAIMTNSPGEDYILITS